MKTFYDPDDSADFNPDACTPSWLEIAWCALARFLPALFACVLSTVHAAAPTIIPLARTNTNGKLVDGASIIASNSIATLTVVTQISQGISATGGVPAITVTNIANESSQNATSTIPALIRSAVQIGYSVSSSTNLAPGKYHFNVTADTAFTLTNFTNGAVWRLSTTNTGSYAIGFNNNPGASTNRIAWARGAPRGRTNVWTDYDLEQTATNIIADFSDRILLAADFITISDGTNDVPMDMPVFAYTNVAELTNSPHIRALAYLKSYWGTNDAYGSGLLRYHATGVADGIVSYTNYARGGIWTRIRENLNEVNVGWAGIAGDSVTDDSAAFQRVRNAYKRDVHIVVPSGIFGIGNVWTNATGEKNVEITGTAPSSRVAQEAMGSSVLRWVGATNGPGIIAYDCADGPTLKHLVFVLPHTNTPARVISMEQSGLGGGIMSDWWFEGLSLINQNTNPLHSLWCIAVATNSPNNCEGGIFLNVWINGFGLDWYAASNSVQGYHFGNSANSLNHEIINGGILNCTNAIFFHNGSLRVRGKGLWNQNAVGVCMITAIDHFEISGIRSETERQFFVLRNDVGGTTASVTLDGNTVNDNTMWTTNLPIIEINGQGRFNITRNNMNGHRALQPSLRVTDGGARLLAHHDNNFNTNTVRSFAQFPGFNWENYADEFGEGFAIKGSLLAYDQSFARPTNLLSMNTNTSAVIIGGAYSRLGIATNLPVATLHAMDRSGSAATILVEDGFVAGRLSLLDAGGVNHVNSQLALKTGSGGVAYWDLGADTDLFRFLRGPTYMTFSPEGSSIAQVRFGDGSGNTAGYYDKGTNFYWYGDMAISKSLSIGPNALAVTNVLGGSGTLDFDSINAQTEQDLPITVTGAAVGDKVTIGTPVPLAGIVYSGYASNNVVFIRAANYSAGSKDPASGTFKALVIKP